MANIKYVARALNELCLGNKESKTVAYFVSKAYIHEGAIIGNSSPFVLADFSSLFGKVPLLRRKGFIIEDGLANYKLICFDTYDECNVYVQKLNDELLERKTAFLGGDKATLKRHKKDVDYAKKLELIYADEYCLEKIEKEELSIE